MEFTEISPYDLKENFFSAIDRDWMLITAKNKHGQINTMTASWGGTGIMWNKPVCMCMIRPQRYTFDFVEQNDRLTLSFLDDGNREALKICGSKSGRDCDKIREAGLETVVEGDFAYFSQSRLVVVGRKIYADDVKENCFIDRKIITEKYPLRDYHRMYICEIEKILIKE